MIKWVCLDAVAINMDAAFVFIGTGPAAGAVVAALFVGACRASGPASLVEPVPARFPAIFRFACCLMRDA